MPSVRKDVRPGLFRCGGRLHYSPLTCILQTKVFILNPYNIPMTRNQYLRLWVERLLSDAASRLGFMAGQIEVPDDFDSMGDAEIGKMFEAAP